MEGAFRDLAVRQRFDVNHFGGVCSDGKAHSYTTKLNVAAFRGSAKCLTRDLEAPRGEGGKVGKGKRARGAAARRGAASRSPCAASGAPGQTRGSLGTHDREATI